MKNKEMPAGAPAVPGDSELAELGVAAAAAAIRNGDITAESYSAALLRRARDYSDLNSFITIDESAVLAAARDADKARAAGSSAPLLGVPIGVKDSYATRGVRTTLGVETLDSFVPAEDADVVGAIKDAGGHVFGKINLVEMSFGLTGDNSRYGQVKNPYGPEHVPGGVLEWLRGICRGSDRACGIGGRYRWLDQGARVTVRRGGLQADHGTMAAGWCRAGFAHARHDRNPGAQRRRRRADRSDRHEGYGRSPL